MKLGIEMGVDITHSTRIMKGWCVQVLWGVPVYECVLLLLSCCCLMRQRWALGSWAVQA